MLRLDVLFEKLFEKLNEKLLEKLFEKLFVSSKTLKKCPSLVGHSVLARSKG